MRPEQQTEYIVQCVRESGSMYEDDARTFLAEHDAHIRAEVLAADGQEYDGQLVMLTGLVTTIRATVAHGNLDDVRKLLEEYERDDQNARAVTRGRPFSRRRQVNHAATAAFLRARPGEWHPVGYYAKFDTATSTASAIRNGGLGVGVHYRPGRVFEARLKRAAGGAVVEARFVGAVSVEAVKRQAADAFLAAREHTAAESERIAYALDARLVLHPELLSTNEDYPAWTPGGAR